MSDGSERRSHGQATPPHIPSAHTALLVIDVQNDYAHHDGWFGSRGYDLTQVDATLPRIVTLIDGARASGVPVLYTRNWHRPETDSPAMVAHLERGGMTQQSRPALAESWGAQLIDAIEPRAGEEIVNKFRYDAFLGTNLEYLLRARSIDTVVCAGVTTNVCVESTARAAYMRDFHVFLVDDGCAAYDRATHDAGVRNIGRSFGQIAHVDDVIWRWSAP
jgi:ureidoacrylate peracid hydrolase